MPAQNQSTKRNSRKQRLKLANSLRDTIVDLCAALSSVGQTEVANQITGLSNLKNPVQLMADFQESESPLRAAIPVDLLADMGPAGREYLKILSIYAPKTGLRVNVSTAPQESGTELDGLLARARPYVVEVNNPFLNLLYASVLEMKDNPDLQLVTRDCIALIVEVLGSAGGATGEINQIELMGQLMPFFQEKQALIVQTISRLAQKVTAQMPSEEIKVHIKSLATDLAKDYPEIQQYVDVLDDPSQMVGMAGPIMAAMGLGGGGASSDGPEKFQGVEVDWEKTLADQVDQLDIEN